jgi:glycosyltransferase involved in cell wall biosynthesis
MVSSAHTTLRVAITVPHASLVGGVSAFWEIVAPELGQAVHVVRVGRQPDSEPLLPRILRSVRTTCQTPRQARAFGADLVVLNPSLDPKALVRDGLSLLLLRLAKQRVFVFFHGWDSSTERLIDRYLHRFFLAVFSRADCIAVLSSSFRARLRTWGYTGPAALVTTVAPYPERPLSPPKVAARESGQGVRILFMARLVPGKGMEATLRALVLLRDAGLYPSLVMAGDGPSRGAGEELARTLDLSNVSFVGHVSGQVKADLLRGSDIFVLPSSSEGMPVSVLEAMSNGLAVVVTPVGGLADIVTGGENALLLESPSPNDIAAKLGTLCRDADLRQSLGEAGRRLATRTFLPDAVGGRMARLFVSTVENVLEHDPSWLDDVATPDA